MEHNIPATSMWPICQQTAGADHGSVASYLDFLSEDLIVGSHNPLDAGTLAAAAAAQEPIPADNKRKRLKREAVDADVGSNEEDLSDDDEDEPRGKGSSKRKGSAAAQNKANREKARREKINDRFTELAKIVDPSNEPKTDKLSILGEAIRFVQQTQVENCQLKQLNKFLEEKVGQLEKERAQMLYQMYQYSGGQMMQGPAGMMPPLLMPGMVPPMQQPVMQPAMQPTMQQLMPPAAAGAAGCSNVVQQTQMAVMQPPLQMVASSSTPSLQQQSSLPQQLPEQQDQQQQQQPGQQQQLPTMLAPPQSQFQQQQQLPMLQGKQVMSVAGAPMPMPWQSMMPASMLDSTQDSLLRPPAA